jgi:hypothetical protein
VKADPRLVNAFVEALKEAADFINEKPAEAARIYVAGEKAKSTPEQMLEIMKQGGAARLHDAHRFLGMILDRPRRGEPLLQVGREEDRAPGGHVGGAPSAAGPLGVIGMRTTRVRRSASRRCAATRTGSRS